MASSKLATQLGEQVCICFLYEPDLLDKMSSVLYTQHDKLFQSKERILSQLSGS